MVAKIVKDLPCLIVRAYSHKLHIKIPWTKLATNPIEVLFDMVECVFAQGKQSYSLVEVKFKFLQNISHYCNKRFPFHMPMFIIFILSPNKLNTTIHSNIIFMVIGYNQNLHFKIHWKKLQKQYYNSFHHILILQTIHTTIWT
jgi:hypothetical protein